MKTATPIGRDREKRKTRDGGRRDGRREREKDRERERMK